MATAAALRLERCMARGTKERRPYEAMVEETVEPATTTLSVPSVAGKAHGHAPAPHLPHDGSARTRKHQNPEVASLMYRRKLR